MRLGVLDIGSATAHLLVVDAHYGAAPLPAHSRKVELRLAEGRGPGATIGEDAVQALQGFVRGCRELAEDLGVRELEAFATSALRDASNGREITGLIRDSTGVDIRVLSGEDEARLTFLAVRRWFGWSSARLMVLDNGGGSLEIAVGADEEPEAACSFPLGSIRTTQEWLDDDPPSAEAVRGLRRHARALIADRVGRLQRLGPPERAVATSKTFSQLARIAGAEPTLEGASAPRALARVDLATWVPKLASMTHSEISELPGVSTGRARQLLAGAIVAESAMDLLEIESVDICPWALREGVILSRLDRLRADRW